MAVNRRGWTMLSLYQSDDEPRLATVTSRVRQTLELILLNEESLGVRILRIPLSQTWAMKRHRHSNL
jgi:hypothetical protein